MATAHTAPNEPAPVQQPLIVGCPPFTPVAEPAAPLSDAVLRQAFEYGVWAARQAAERGGFDAASYVIEAADLDPDLHACMVDLTERRAAR